ncbi:unnamed protein product, partial [Amoebophrya sp. A120]
PAAVVPTSTPVNGSSAGKVMMSSPPLQHDSYLPGGSVANAGNGIVKNAEHQATTAVPMNSPPTISLNSNSLLPTTGAFLSSQLPSAPKNSFCIPSPEHQVFNGSSNGFSGGTMTVNNKNLGQQHQHSTSISDPTRRFSAFPLQSGTTSNYAGASTSLHSSSTGPPLVGQNLAANAIRHSYCAPPGVGGMGIMNTTGSSSSVLKAGQLSSSMNNGTLSVHGPGTATLDTTSSVQLLAGDHLFEDHDPRTQ